MESASYNVSVQVPYLQLASTIVWTVDCALQFVDGSGRLLSIAERDSSTGWFSKEDTSKPGVARSLRMFMESFVTEKFLPEIYLDFRWDAATCLMPYINVLQVCVHLHFEKPVYTTALYLKARFSKCIMK